MKNLRMLLALACFILLLGDLGAGIYGYHNRNGRAATEAAAEVEDLAQANTETEVSTEKARAVETKAPETEAPETEAPETKAPETAAPETQSETVDNRKLIVLDPGHQECDFPDEDEPLGPGAKEEKHKYSEGDTGKYSGITEAELCLEIAEGLKTELEDRGYKVILTRTDNNTLLSSKERADVATVAGADVYLRIHGNENKDGSVSGAACIVPKSDNKYVGYMYDQCLELGQLVLNAYCEATGFENDGILKRNDVCGINWSTVPVALIELGYLSNAGDDLSMADASFQSRMVSGIADGLDRYLEKR